MTYNDVQYASLKGKHAIITGGATGLGAEMVRAYRQQGANVSFLDIDVQNAEELATETGATFVECDVTEIPTLRETLSTIIDRRGAPAVLINNAGIADGRWASVEAIDFDVATEVLEVNAIAPVRVTQAALPRLADGGGTVVMITSLMGSIADCMSGRSYAYRASKTALNMFTVAMKNELRDLGVSVLLIHPGWVETDMGGPNAPIQAEESVSGIMARIEEQTLDHTGRFVDYTGQVLPW